MTLLGFLLLLLIAGICGSLAQALVGYSHGGCLVSIVLGLIGALLGTWLAKLVDTSALRRFGALRERRPNARWEGH